MKTLEDLKRLIDEVSEGEMDRFDPESTCSGQCYKRAAESNDMVSGVREFLEDHCDRGMSCDQCDLYKVLSGFVSDVVVTGSKENGFNMMHLNENQFTELCDALNRWEELLWGDIGDEFIEESDKVELYTRVRIVGELLEVMKRKIE